MNTASDDRRALAPPPCAQPHDEPHAVDRELVRRTQHEPERREIKQLLLHDLQASQRRNHQTFDHALHPWQA